MLSVAAIAWLGFLVHTVADLPNQTLLSPETLWPSLVTVALLVHRRDRLSARRRDRPVRVDPG